MAGTTRRTRAHLGSVSALTLLTSAFATSATAQSITVLDAITIIATKTEELAINTLAPVSAIRQEQIQQLQPGRVSNIFAATPGVAFQDRGDEPASSINIRGLQDFGRVAVLIDGARQNFQRTGHFANGFFYLDPEMIGGADVVRGPTSNIYGSGAIGGVVTFRTKEVSDILAPHQKWGTEVTGFAGDNTGMGAISAFAAHRTVNVDTLIGIVHRDQSNYRDGNRYQIQNSWQQTTSALFKGTLRPADFHSLTLSGLVHGSDYNFGQPARPGLALSQGTSVYATDVNNYTFRGQWKYDNPNDRLFNWDASAYWNRTDTQQNKIYHNSMTPNVALCGPGVPGNNITGCLGSFRSFVLDTHGFDVNNTSRFETGAWRHAITFGADVFTDVVATVDATGTGDLTTPGGSRTVSGGFVQWKANYLSWLEIISAGRYDNYSLKDGSSGDRFSPKITIGVTPVNGVTPYVSYAEGYRSPSLTETLVTGGHPTGSGFGPWTCNGNISFFCFVPNPNLRPEVGKNKEVGINLKFDSIYKQGDAFRAKFNVFRNDIEDFIEFTGFGAFSGAPYNTFNFYSYQNVSQARIEGVELEATYDAGSWFYGLAGQYQHGRNQVTSAGLANIQPNKIVNTFGLRFMDNRLTTMVRWISAAARTDLPASYRGTESYQLVNLYIGYQISQNAQLGFSAENLLDEFYHPYPIVGTTPTDNQNDTLWASAAPGRTFKGSLRIRFGDGVPLIPYTSASR